MSRIRTPPRQAARHTGDLYDRGFQWENEREFSFQLGPWKKIDVHESFSQNHVKNVALDTEEKQTLVDSYGMHIVNGKAYSVPERQTVETITNADILGTGAVILGGTLYSLLFYRDTADSNYIKVRARYGNSASTWSSTIVSDGSPVSFVAWGSDVYFVADDLTDVRKVTSGGVFSTVSGSPDNGYFIFVNNNNLCVANESSGVWSIYWSVDGDPTDWSSAGAGSQVINRQIGPVYGVEDIGESSFIICQFGATRMSPTGTLPAFRFQVEPGITGCAERYATASSGNIIVYNTLSQYLGVFDGNRTILLNNNAELGRVRYSKVLDRFVAFKYNSFPYYIDPSSLEVVGRPMWTETPSHFADGFNNYPLTYWYEEDTGDVDVIKLEENNDLSGSGGLPVIITPFIDIGREVEIVGISMYFNYFKSLVNVAISSNTLYFQLEDGTSDFLSVASQDVALDSLNYVPVNRTARQFAMKLIGSASWSCAVALKYIRVHCQLLSDEGVARVRG